MYRFGFKTQFQITFFVLFSAYHTPIKCIFYMYSASPFKWAFSQIYSRQLTTLNIDN